MKKLSILILALATAAIVYAQIATISIPRLDITDQAQLRGIAWATRQANQTARQALPEEERAAFVPITRQQYLQARIQDLLESYAEQEAAAVRSDVEAAVKDPARSATVLQAAGVTNRTYGFQ